MKRVRHAPLLILAWLVQFETLLSGPGNPGRYGAGIDSAASRQGS